MLTAAYERFMRGRLMLGGAQPRSVASRCGRLEVLDIPGTGRLPTVVLLHGFSASASTQFAGMIPALRRDFARIVAPDLPGHGASTKQGVSPEAMVDGLIDVLDQAVEEPALVFASSLSGAVAVRAANARARRVRGLMLCSPSGAPVADDELRSLRDTLRIRSHGDALAFVDRVFTDLGPAPVKHVYALAIRQQFAREHLVRLIAEITPEHFLRSTELAALSMPVSLLWGEQERLFSRDQLAFFRAHLPAGSRIESPAHYGHSPFLEHPADVAARLTRFGWEVEHSRRPALPSIAPARVAAPEPMPALRAISR